jgi:AraC-like DNA-binding protein
MQYREYPVPENLRRHVACLWRLSDAQPAGGVQTIYPDGCCELIVHLGTPPRAWDAKQDWHDQAATLFAAQHLHAVRLQAAGPLECVGLRLQPEASTVLGKGTRVRNRILDLAQIDASLARALRRAVRDFLAGDDAAPWRLAERSFARHELDAQVAQAVALLRESAGAIRIESVARRVCLSLRSLQVRFRAAVGLTPKEFARVMRLRATLRALGDGDDGIAEVAAERGFSDQAHATRELRRITGLAPARLRAALRTDRDGDAAIRLAAAFLRGNAQ